METRRQGPRSAQVPLRAIQVLIGVLHFSRRPTPGTGPSAAGQRGRHQACW